MNPNREAERSHDRRRDPRTAALRVDGPGVPREGSFAEPGARTARRRHRLSTPTGGSARPNWAGPACWSPRSSAAAASRVTVSPTSRWSPSRSAGPSPRARCTRSAPCWPAGRGARRTTKTTIESLVSGELIASWAVYEPGRPWAPLDTSGDGDRAPTPASGSTASRTASRPAPRAALLLVVAQCDGAVRQFLVPTDAAGVTVETQRSIDLVKRYARVQFRRRRGRRVRGGRHRRADRGPDRTAEPDRAGAAVRRGRRHSRHRAGLHRPVGVRPALLRPAAGVVPGAQAPVRRHEDVARGVPGHHRAAVAEVAPRPPDADMAVSVAKSYVGEHARACCRTAFSCTAVSASPGNTTCICSCAESRCTARCSVRPRITTCASTR